MATEKTCFKCLKPKPLDEFYRHAQMGDGHLNKCKECTRGEVRANRLAKLEQYRAYDRRRASEPHRVAARKEYAVTPEGRAAHARALKKQRELNPIKYKARMMLGNAVKSGKIARLPCFVCGEPETQGHHPDYTSPLDVVWLCEPHHNEIHFEMEFA